MNNTHPYEITPNDLTKAMLEHNVAPSYDQLSALIGERKAIPIHDPEFFDQKQVAKKADLDLQALTVMRKLHAPDLVYNIEVIEAFDRLWQDAVTRNHQGFVEAILKDDPGFDLQDKAQLARISRTILSNTVMKQAMERCHLFSSYFINKRIEHGVDPGVHSAVTSIPDLKPDGTQTFALISVHGVENNLGDERLYVDLYRP